MDAPTTLRSPDSGHTAVRVDHHLDEVDAVGTMAAEIREGLTRSLKELPAKYLYDDRGSDLFEQITRLPEYYPTRTERAILKSSAADIIRQTHPRELVELGAGSASKSRVLLDEMTTSGLLTKYVPVDISASMVRETAHKLVEEYGGLQVHAVVGDFERHLDRLPPGESRLVAFLGGTIGNLEKEDRARMLGAIRNRLSPNSHLLLGTDLVKDVAELESAYNDSAGVTAAFNRNVLHALNRSFDGDFDPNRFAHVAFYDHEQARIEMRLRACEAHSVLLRTIDLEIEFQGGEDLRTEISCKFTREQLNTEFAEVGLKLVGWYTDPQERFALSLAAPAG